MPLGSEDVLMVFEMGLGEFNAGELNLPSLLKVAGQPPALRAAEDESGFGLEFYPAAQTQGPRRNSLDIQRSPGRDRAGRHRLERKAQRFGLNSRQGANFQDDAVHLPPGTLAGLVEYGGNGRFHDSDFVHRGN